MDRKTKNTIAIITEILLAATVTIATFFCWLMIMFFGLKSHFLIPVCGILLVVLFVLIADRLFHKKNHKKKIVTLTVAIAVLLCVVACEGFYKFHYIPSVTVRDGEIPTKEFLPFADSEYLARLDEDEKPALKFSEQETLPVVDGATALFPVYCSFVEAVYPKLSESALSNYVRFSTTESAYENLIRGKCDIIFVAQPSAAQLAMAKESGVEFAMYPIGSEAFVFIVNRKNRVSNLTLGQIKDIYTGKITNWKNVGGKNQQIKAFQRKTNSGSQTAFEKIMGNDIELITPKTREVSLMGRMVDVVADYENHGNAIGYSFRYYIEKMVDSSKIKMLSVNGIAPTKENIRTGSYPLTNNFYAITIKGRESDAAKKFVEWILSEPGQRLVEKVGYVGVGLRE